MDRRQQKTRAAVFSSFSELLARKPYGRITVQEIIDGANVGRTTFYAHFETKDDLLKELCEELFGHIIDSAVDRVHTHGLYSEAAAPKSVFCHLLCHLQENHRNILGLLSCESNEIFLRYYKESLNSLVESQYFGQNRIRNTEIPKDFLVNHITGSFVEMVQWWIRGGMRRTPEELDTWFRAMIDPVL